MEIGDRIYSYRVPVGFIRGTQIGFPDFGFRISGFPDFFKISDFDFIKIVYGIEEFRIKICVIKMSGLAIMFIISMVHADMYLHNMRGSNNRLDEQNRDRDNANRYGG